MSPLKLVLLLLFTLGSSAKGNHVAETTEAVANVTVGQIILDRSFLTAIPVSYTMRGEWVFSASFQSTSKDLILTVTKGNQVIWQSKCFFANIIRSY